MAKLLDQYGRPVELTRLRQVQAEPTLSGVRSILSGHPAQGLTPARLTRLLHMAEQGDATAYLELAEEMEEKDLHYLSVLGTRKRAVAQLEINVESASDDPRDVENADLIRDWLGREELEDEMFDILDAIGKGFSVTEIIWDMSERQWWPSRLKRRDQRWFEFDRDNGETLYLKGLSGTEDLWPFKYVTHFAAAKSGLPIRGGLARAAAWAAMAASTPALNPADGERSGRAAMAAAIALSVFPVLMFIIRSSLSNGCAPGAQPGLYQFPAPE
ncbi:MAG: hypothetical protein CVU79_09710 [Elusimicrobia bacterium HGW-Elusimicrobia-3]|nr:MAG: hypothetical protein CVU79_09710 [Elusimicrobia bacterium HGW-Elusimicrobia-3]